MAVMLVGAVLGSRLGFLTQALYLLAGAAGLSVFSPSVTLPPGALPARSVRRPGICWPIPSPRSSPAISPSAAGIAATGRRSPRCSLGLGLIFAGGVSWLAIAFAPSIGDAFSQGFLVFIGPDLVKAAVAASILPQVWKLVRLR